MREYDMDNHEMLFPKKQYTRFKVRAGTFVVLKPQTQSSRLGSLLDINHKGLSFQYPISCNLCFDSFAELDVFVSGDGVYIQNIPIEIISEVPIAVQDHYFSTTMRRFGVQFGDLTANHKTLLESFIHNNTTGVLQDRRICDDSSLIKGRIGYDNLDKIHGEQPIEQKKRNIKERREPFTMGAPDFSSNLNSNLSTPQ
jgi:hypothetical protein